MVHGETFKWWFTLYAIYEKLVDLNSVFLYLIRFRFYRKMCKFNQNQFIYFGNSFPTFKVLPTPLKI